MKWAYLLIRIVRTGLKVVMLKTLLANAVLYALLIALVYQNSG